MPSTKPCFLLFLLCFLFSSPSAKAQWGGEQRHLVFRPVVGFVGGTQSGILSSASPFAMVTVGAEAECHFSPRWGAAVGLRSWAEGRTESRMTHYAALPLTVRRQLRGNWYASVGVQPEVAVGNDSANGFNVDVPVGVLYYWDNIVFSMGYSLGLGNVERGQGGHSHVLSFTVGLSL